MQPADAEAPSADATLFFGLLSLFCFVGLFVSSKPVSVGSVVMTAVLAMSCTQAVAGARGSAGLSAPKGALASAWAALGGAGRDATSWLPWGV